MMYFWLIYIIFKRIWILAALQLAHNVFYECLLLQHDVFWVFVEFLVLKRSVRPRVRAF